MNTLLFCVGIFIMGISMAHSKAVKAHLSNFWQWCVKGKKEDVFAWFVVCGVVVMLVSIGLSMI